MPLKWVPDERDRIFCSTNAIAGRVPTGFPAISAPGALTNR